MKHGFNVGDRVVISPNAYKYYGAYPLPEGVTEGVIIEMYGKSVHDIIYLEASVRKRWAMYAGCFELAAPTGPDLIAEMFS